MNRFLQCAAAIPAQYCSPSSAVAIGGCWCRAYGRPSASRCAYAFSSDVMANRTRYVLANAALRPCREQRSPELLSDKKVNRHRPADNDDDEADHFRISGARRCGTHVPADEGSKNHDETVSPHNSPRRHELGQRETVDRRAEERLESVHLVDVYHSDHRERGQHHDPHPTTEVAAVHRDDELQ